MKTHLQQRGYLLVTVIITLFLVASIAVLLAHDSAISANTASTELETARVEYVAQAGMQHALWRAQNNACMGNVTIPDTALGADTYNAMIQGAASGTLVTVPADQDAWIRSDDVSRNNGKTTWNHVRNEVAGTEQVLTRFDLSSLAAKAQISSAVAWFHIKALKPHPEGSITIHEITADWAETDVTWESFAGAYSSSTIGMIPAQDTGDVWVGINLTAQVQAWVNGQPNYGILFDTKGEGIHTEYTAREDGTSPPRLEVVVGSGDASPLTIQATGQLVNGVMRKLKDKIAIAYQPPGTVTLQLGTDPGADAMLDSFYPRNYGGRDFVQVNEDTGNWMQRAVFRFDLGSIPAQSAVLSARLELRLKSLKTPGTITVHRVARSWVEGTKIGAGQPDGASWDTYDGTNSWTTAGGDFNAAAVAETAINGGETWVSWEIGPLVEQWLAGEANNGLLIKSDGVLEEAEFYSKEQADATLRPRLTITYACECGSPCLSQTGSGNILMVVRSATNMWYYDIQKKAILESWGYTVNIIDDDASSAEYDAGIAANDVAYISEPMQEASLNTKLSNAAIGVVSDEGRMNDELGMAQSYATPVLGTAINVSDTSHYITRVFPTGPLDIYTDTMEGLTVAGTEAPDLQTLADWGGAASLVTLEAGASNVSGGSSPGRRVTLPFGRQIDSNLNWDRLNSNGRLIVQRAIEWATTTSSSPGYKVLLIVGDGTTLAGKDLGYKALMESWGHTVTVIDDGASQADYDTAMAAADVIYASGSALGANMLDKATDTAKGLVNEVPGKIDNFGFSSSKSATANFDTFSATNAAHYITEPFGGSPVTVFTSSLTNPVPSGTLAPDLQNVGEVTGTLVLGTLEAGATRYDSDPSQGRRAHLPFTSAETTDMSADGKTILQRAIEWAAGADSSGGLSGTYLDEFNAIAYNGNDGTLDWSDDWQETGESNGPGSGFIVVLNDSWCASGNCLRIREDQTSTRRLHREVDLAGAASATLSLNYRRRHVSNPIGGTVTLEISDNGGSSFTPLKVYDMGSQDAAQQSDSFDISAYIAPDTQIRFSTSNILYETALHVDNVLIDSTGGDGGGGGGGGGPPACDDTFRDEFNTVSFGNNDGTLNWSGNWLEVGESDGPSSNDVRVRDDNGPYQLWIRDNNNGGEGAEREADLTGSTAATLSFVYRRSSLDNANDYVKLEISSNGTAGPWSELARFEGAGTDTDYQNFSHDITSHISSNTRIRLISSPTMGNMDLVIFDDIEICASN